VPGNEQRIAADEPYHTLVESLELVEIRAAFGTVLRDPVRRRADFNDGGGNSGRFERLQERGRVSHPEDPAVEEPAA
jgi:hypothetical protein